MNVWWGLPWRALAFLRRASSCSWLAQSHALIQVGEPSARPYTHSAKLMTFKFEHETPSSQR